MLDGQHYQLFAVVARPPGGSPTIRSGHWLAHVLVQPPHGAAPRWLCFNDDQITQHDSFADVRAAARRDVNLLFYARVAAPAADSEGEAAASVEGEELPAADRLHGSASSKPDAEQRSGARH